MRSTSNVDSYTIFSESLSQNVADLAHGTIGSDGTQDVTYEILLMLRGPGQTSKGILDLDCVSRCFHLFQLSDLGSVKVGVDALDLPLVTPLGKSVHSHDSRSAFVHCFLELVRTLIY